MQQCLLTLTKYTEFPYRIYVINNGSAIGMDGESFEEELRKSVTFPDLHIIQAEKNLGWQDAINLAFQTAEETPFFCMANDDLVFLPESLTFWWKLVNLLQYPEVGAVGPCSNYVMGSQSLWDNRGGGGIFETTLLIGFLMVVRSKAFAEVGGLDGGLIGGDDLDLSILLRKAGYRLLCNRQCYVHHIGSQTGPRVTPKAYWNSIDHIDRSNNSLIRKHGVRAWYECISSQIRRFEPVTVMDDTEGDLIRERIEFLGALRAEYGDAEPKGLDIGCGGNKTVPDAIGVDRDEAGTVGQAGGRKDTPCVADVVADILALPFDDGSQDYIVARHVLEHMVDPIKALREWNRVLKPGGTAAIACPNEEMVYGMVLDWTHKHAFTAKSLRTMAELTGFEVESEHDLSPGISFVSFLRKAA